jgi:hypothetical protein
MPSLRWPCDHDQVHDLRERDTTVSIAVTVYGVCAVSFMMAMYALERRHRSYILAFAAGCLLSSAYGFLSGAWPFGVVELIWSGVAVQRYRRPAVGAVSGDAD